MDIKVVINIKGDRAQVGVQSPDTDPVLGSVPIVNQEDALEEAFAGAADLVGRAREKWADNPKNPAYERPAPPPGTVRPAATAAPQPARRAPARQPATTQNTLF